MIRREAEGKRAAIAVYGEIVSRLFVLIIQCGDVKANALESMQGTVDFRTRIVSLIGAR